MCSVKLPTFEEWAEQSQINKPSMFQRKILTFERLRDFQNPIRGTWTQYIDVHSAIKNARMAGYEIPDGMAEDYEEWLQRMQKASEKLDKSVQEEILSNFKKAATAKFFDDGYQNSNPTKTHGIPPKHMTHHLPHQPENNVGLFYYKEKRSWLDRLMEMIPRRFTS
jgi:hypothetical protein